MKLPSRNSRATGPKIRVPRGPLSSRMITHAFSSNLMYEPSLRRTPDLVRTITALTTSPFLTTPPGVAFLTVHTITSPMFAVLRPDPPNTLIVRTSRAPELSATFKRVSCWIIS
ncbi:50S ribosomal protein L14 [Staphylococcus aureus]|nr:50S ribosomal protein L14 [Staphylococcus aureus]